MVKITSKSANNPDFEQTGYIVELEKDQLLYLPFEDASNIELCEKIEAILNQEEQFDFVNGLISLQANIALWLKEENQIR